VSKVNTFFASEMLLLLRIFLNSNEEPSFFSFALLMCQEQSEEAEKTKTKKSYLIVDVRDVFVAVDVVQPLLPFRFFQLFQLFQLLFRLIGFGRVSTRRTRRHLFSLFLSLTFEFDSIRTSKTIDESAL